MKERGKKKIKQLKTNYHFIYQIKILVFYVVIYLKDNDIIER